MSYKRILASENGDGTIFELDCGLYALCKHSRSTSRAWYACNAGAFMVAYSSFAPIDKLPANACDADIAVIEAIERMEETNGISKEKERALKQLHEHIKNNPDYLVWREGALK